MAGIPRHAVYIFCEGYAFGTHHVKATNVGHILWQVYLDMLGTCSARGMPGYASCKGYH